MLAILIFIRDAVVMLALGWLGVTVEPVREAAGPARGGEVERTLEWSEQDPREADRSDGRSCRSGASATCSAGTSGPGFSIECTANAGAL